MTEVGEEPTSFMSDCSFIILGSDSLSSEISNSPNQSLNISQLMQQNQQTSLKSLATPDSVPDPSGLPESSMSEIQQKLDLLVKENLLLKETLNQSNVAMKNQFDTLVQWHQEVVKTHESHKQKYQMTQEHISKLKLENENLKKFVEDKLESGEYSPVLVSLPQERLSSSFDIPDNVPRETEMKLEKTNKLNSDLMLQIEKLKTSLNNMTQEKMDLEKRLDVAEKKLEQTKIEKHCTEESLNSSISLSDKSSSSMSECEKAMKKDYVLLKGKIKEQQDMLEKNSIEMKKMMLNHTDLKNEVTTNRATIRHLINESESFKSELKVKDELLRRKEDCLEEMKKEMKKLVLNCEEVEILRIQVETYKSDFNDERMARERAVNEKEDMAEQLRIMERELEILKKCRNNDESLPPKEKSDEMEKLICFKCFKEFSENNTYTSHVESCVVDVCFD